MNEIFKIVLSLSVSGSFLILFLFLFKPLFRSRINKRWQYYIWLIVIMHLLLPFTPEQSPVGVLFQRAGRTAGVEAPPVLGYGNAAPQPENHTTAENLLGKYALKFSLSFTMAEVFLNLILPYSGLIWFIAALVLLTRKITLYQSFIHYIHVGETEVSDPKILDRLAEIGKQAGVKKPVELYVNQLISSPMLFGFLRPCIVLPSTDLTDADFEYTILHELAHYRKHDIFYKWLIQFTICIHWFNPFVHLMGRELIQACELACDESVLLRLDSKQRRAYGDTLMNAAGAGGNYKDSLVSMTLSESGELLKERLCAIMKFKKRSKYSAVLPFTFTLFLTTGAMTMGAYATSQLPDGNISAHSDIFSTKESLSPEDTVKAFLSQSYYRGFQATKIADNYEISGTLYQNKTPRSLVRFETSSETKLTVSGSITPVEGELKLVYKDEAGTVTTLTEGISGTGESIAVFFVTEIKGKGEFYFESDSGICNFDLSFSNGDEIRYYLTNENPIGLSY